MEAHGYILAGTADDSAAPRGYHTRLHHGGDGYGSGEVSSYRGDEGAAAAGGFPGSRAVCQHVGTSQHDHRSACDRGSGRQGTRSAGRGRLPVRTGIYDTGHERRRALPAAPRRGDAGGAGGGTGTYKDRQGGPSTAVGRRKAQGPWYEVQALRAQGAADHGAGQRGRDGGVYRRADRWTVEKACDEV